MTGINRGFGLTDSTGRTDSYYKPDDVYKVPSNRRIIRLDATISKDERTIRNIVVKLDDGTEKQLGPNEKGRTVSFEIAPGEHLVGAEVEYLQYYFSFETRSITWIVAKEI